MQLLCHSHRYCRHCLYEKDVTASSSMLIPHICPAQAGQHREEALPLPAPTYTAQLSGEHREHRWPSPVPSLLMIRLDSASTVWCTQYRGHCCWPQVLSLFRSSPLGFCPVPADGTRVHKPLRFTAHYNCWAQPFPHTPSSYIHI